MDEWPVGLLTLDAAGTVLDVNATLLAWMGRDAPDLVGRRIHDLLTVGGRIFWETHLAPLLHVEGRLDELDGTVQALFAAGMRRVLLEGALARLGTAAPERADSVVVAAGAAAARGPDDIERALRLAVEALALPVEGGTPGLCVKHAAGFEAEVAGRIEAGRATHVEVAGAVTGPLLELLMRRGIRLRLVAADATHVLAQPQQVARARRAGVELMVRRPLPIVALTASPFHPDVELTADQAFAAAAAAAAGRWPVFDVVSGRMSA